MSAFFDHHPGVLVALIICATPVVTLFVAVLLGVRVTWRP